MWKNLFVVIWIQIFNISCIVCEMWLNPQQAGGFTLHVLKTRQILNASPQLCHVVCNVWLTYGYCNGCKEGRNVPSVHASVFGCWEKWSEVTRSSNEQMSGGRWGSEVTLFPLSLSPLHSLLPFFCLSFLHMRVCVCVCLLLAQSRSMLLIDSCGCWAAHWRRGQSSNEFLHLMPLAPTPTPPL